LGLTLKNGLWASYFSYFIENERNPSKTSNIYLFYVARKHKQLQIHVQMIFHQISIKDVIPYSFFSLKAILYIITTVVCVRPSDWTVPRFNTHDGICYNLKKKSQQGVVGREGGGGQQGLGGGGRVFFFLFCFVLF
jgi:hypothetical protein